MNKQPQEITIDLGIFYQENAKVEKCMEYQNKAATLAGDGNIIRLTGRAPIWLYLVVAHALHGKAQKLLYNSPVTGDVLIFDHNPY
ncbi:MAG TPA: CRISPR-associated protein Csx3 [bacterium]|nr:CRISPR-associated protein Csx3 [bacterium]